MWAAGESTASGADLLISNAVVYTLDASVPWVTDIAVSGGTVLAVGDDATMRAHCTSDTDVRDMHGAFVMPGLVDVHNHHSLAGKADLFEVTFPATAPLTEILAAVSSYAATLDDDAWVVGGSWGSTLVDQLCHTSARRALDDAAGGVP